MRISNIRSLFSSHGEALTEVIRSAEQAEILINSISPIIESYTSQTCPACTSVCCINRHSRFDRSDVIFMAALGKDIPEELQEIPETDACRFLGMRGCILKRTERPYRCTWFFCSALMDQIVQQPSVSAYRNFLEMLRNISENRMKMINVFEKLETTLPPHFGQPAEPQKNK